MKYLPYLRVVLIVIAALLSVLAISGTMEIDTMLYLAYILLGLTMASALLMPLIGIAQNPKGALKSLVGIAIVCVVVLIAYGISSAESVPLSNGTKYTDTFGLRFTDTALFTTFFAFAGVLIAIVGTEFYRIFK